MCTCTCKGRIYVGFNRNVDLGIQNLIVCYNQRSTVCQCHVYYRHARASSRLPLKKARIAFTYKQDIEKRCGER